MLQQLAILAGLRINDHPPELKKNKVEAWLKGFVLKLKRKTSRSQKCRLLSAVERTEFSDDENAYYWQYCEFGAIKATIYNKWKNKREDFEMTAIQKEILAAEPALRNNLISRWEIKEERGEWELPDEIKGKLISEGGEALVISELFGNLEAAVRVQVFDPFLFTDGFGADSFSWRIHLSKGKNFIFIYFHNFRFQTSKR